MCELTRKIWNFWMFIGVDTNHFDTHKSSRFTVEFNFSDLLFVHLLPSSSSLLFVSLPTNVFYFILSSSVTRFFFSVLTYIWESDSFRFIRHYILCRATCRVWCNDLTFTLNPLIVFCLIRSVDGLASILYFNCLRNM